MSPSGSPQAYRLRLRWCLSEIWWGGEFWCWWEGWCRWWRLQLPWHIPHIRPFFLAQFFSMPMRVNRDKMDFETKQSKSHKRKILQQNSIKCDKTSKNVHIMTDFPHISHVEKFPHVTKFPHIYHLENFPTWHVMGRISPHDQFFLHRQRLWRLWQISGMSEKCAISQYI